MKNVLDPYFRWDGLSQKKTFYATVPLKLKNALMRCSCMVSTVCAGKEKDSSYNIPDAGARVHLQNTE